MLDKQGNMFARACARPRSGTHARARTHRQMCNIYRFSTSTMVSRKGLNVTLYVHCLYCFNIPAYGSQNLILNIVILGSQVVTIIFVSSAIRRFVLWFRFTIFNVTDVSRSCKKQISPKWWQIFIKINGITSHRTIFISQYSKLYHSPQVFNFPA
jgi:hypothetical protein